MTTNSMPGIGTAAAARMPLGRPSRRDDRGLRTAPPYRPAKRRHETAGHRLVYSFADGPY